MTTAILEPTQTGTDLIEITPQTAIALFTDKAKYSEFYARIKAETDKFVPDLRTKKGRDAIASEARKVVTTKTTLEKAGKALVEEWRTKTSAVTSARIEMVNELDALAKEVRRPLTEWEEAEKARTARADALILGMKEYAVITLEDTAATVRERGAALWVIALDPEELADRLNEASEVKEAACATLQRALARLTKEEADRAELARLREEKEAREEADRLADEKAEAAHLEAERVENERLAAERAEQHRIEAAKIEEERQRLAAEQEAERIEQARKDAADKAQHQAEQKARDELAERDRQHAAEIARLKKVQDDAEAARQAEAARLAEEKRKAAAAQAKREESVKHRTAVKKKAKEAIMRFGVSEEIATALVLGIIGGEVPAVTLAF